MNKIGAGGYTLNTTFWLDGQNVIVWLAYIFVIIVVTRSSQEAARDQQEAPKINESYHYYIILLLVANLGKNIQTLLQTIVFFWN